MKRLILLLPVLFILNALLSLNTNAGTIANSGNVSKTPVGSFDYGGVVTSNNTHRLTIKNEVLSIPATAFRIVQGTGTVEYDPTGTIRFSSTGKNVDLATPLLLPQGAQVTSVQMYAMDITKDADLSCRIQAYAHSSTNSTLQIAAGSTSGTDFTGIKSWPLTVKSVTIQNDVNSYEVHCGASVWPGGTTPFLALRSVVIKYTYSTAN